MYKTVHIWGTDNIIAIVEHALDFTQITALTQLGQIEDLVQSICKETSTANAQAKQLKYQQAKLMGPLNKGNKETTCNCIGEVADIQTCTPAVPSYEVENLLPIVTHEGLAIGIS